MLTRSSRFAFFTAAIALVAAGCGGNKLTPVGPDHDAGSGGGVGSTGGGSNDADAGEDGGTGGGTGGGSGGGTGGGTGGGAGGGSGGGTGGGSGGGSGAVDAGTVVRFIAIGDTGKASADQQKVADAMTAKCAASGCDFVYLLGDNIYPSGCDSTTDTQWQTKFETYYAALNIPFYAVLGNHDYGGDGTGSEFSKGQHQVDYTNVSTKWKMPAKYYHWRTGDVEFFAGDSNMQMYHSDSDQEADFPAWFSASTAKWKIYVDHHPYKSNGTHGNAGNYDGVSWLYIANGKGVRDFFESVVCGKADLAISGHDHSRQWLVDTCNGTELMVSGAGGSTTAIEGTQPAHYQSATVGFVYFTIAGNSLTAEFINGDGVSEYTRTITK